MSTFSDEPVLVPASPRRDWRRWALAALVLGVAGVFIYIPLNESRLEEEAHEAPRGSHQGALIKITVDGAPHDLELTWLRNRFAPVMTPPPPSGATLRLKGRFGEETLSWNSTLGAFGPGSAEVNPFTHYKLSLRLEREGRVLWSDSAWAYGIHEGHGH